MELLIVFWLLCGLIAGAIGARKGAGCLSFFMGCVFGPFGILFAVLFNGNRVPCPFCREMKHPEAKVCPHCQREVPG